MWVLSMRLLPEVSRLWGWKLLTHLQWLTGPLLFLLCLAIFFLGCPSFSQIPLHAPLPPTPKSIRQVRLGQATKQRSCWSNGSRSQPIRGQSISGVLRGNWTCKFGCRLWADELDDRSHDQRGSQELGKYLEATGYWIKLCPFTLVRLLIYCRKAPLNNFQKSRHFIWS